uniref:Uncharacterized protein n=1 Tax=Ralstonia solanacearum TaxID=305 RepID=A0A0S4X1W4_RALSL|nr:protein of unknown function [Ralstonia solanacearum]
MPFSVSRLLPARRRKWLRLHRLRLSWTRRRRQRAPSPCRMFLSGARQQIATRLIIATVRPEGGGRACPKWKLLHLGRAAAPLVALACGSTPHLKRHNCACRRAP